MVANMLTGMSGDASKLTETVASYRDVMVRMGLSSLPRQPSSSPSSHPTPLALRLQAREVVKASVGEVRSWTDWDLVWTRPNPAVPVWVWDFPKNLGPLGLWSGQS